MQTIDLGNPLNRSWPPNRGIVGHWLALPNSMGGSRFFDIAGTNHGTLTNMAFPPTATSGWSSSRGRPGGLGALAFDGSNDYVLMPAAVNGVTNTGAKSIAFWLNIVGASGSGDRIVYHNVGGVSFQALVSSTNTVSFSVAGNATGLVISMATVTQGEWNHWFGTWDGTSTIVYLNGKAVSTSTGGTSVSPTNFTLGGRSDISRYLNGSLDDVRVFDRALSASEILEIYNDSRTGYPQSLNWTRPRRVGYVAGGGGGNRRRRVICGGAY